MPVLASCCRFGSTYGCCDPPGCWPSSRSAPRQCVVLGVALRLARRSRYQQSITLVCIGNWVSVLLVTFIAPALLPVMVLVALVPVVFAEPYVRWQRGLAFTVIAAGCVLALGALARFQNISHLAGQAPRWIETAFIVVGTADQCPSPPGDCVEQRRGAEDVGGTARRTRRPTRGVTYPADHRRRRGTAPPRT